MSLFKSLGYVTIQTADIDRWRQFAFQLIGFAEGKGPDGVEATWAQRFRCPAAE